MNALRIATAAGLVLLVAGGYLGSQWSVWTGAAVDWHARVDTAPVRGVAALLLIAAIVLAFVPAREVSE